MSNNAVPDSDLERRGGGGGHPDPFIGGGAGLPPEKIFFGLKIRGRRRTRAAALDPPL